MRIAQTPLGLCKAFQGEFNPLKDREFSLNRSESLLHSMISIYIRAKINKIEGLYVTSSIGEILKKKEKESIRT